MADSDEKPMCGLIMPISGNAECSASHWLDVKSIISTAVNDAGFRSRLVSVSEPVGIIQKNILNNIYSDDVVVCDVSCKNPNVMFELGLRLAFDKPTVVIKDEVTDYSFDTSPIEHLTYPRDLRYGAIVEFKSTLSEKVKKTYEIAKDPTFKGSFLKSFGDFVVAKIETKEIPEFEFIIQELRSLRTLVESQKDRPKNQRSSSDLRLVKTLKFHSWDMPPDELDRMSNWFLSSPGISGVTSFEENGQIVFEFRIDPGFQYSDDAIINMLRAFRNNDEQTRQRRFLADQLRSYKPSPDTSAPPPAQNDPA